MVVNNGGMVATSASNTYFHLNLLTIFLKLINCEFCKMAENSKNEIT